MAQNIFLVRRRIAKRCSLKDIPDPRLQYSVAFETREQAQAHAESLDVFEWTTNGPPQWVKPFERGVEAVTTMPEPIFRDWLLDAGITIPPPVPTPPIRPSRHASRRLKELERKNIESWKNWWEMIRPPEGPLNSDQLCQLREGLNKRSLWIFEVSEVESVGSATGDGLIYALVLHRWKYDGDWFNDYNELRAAYHDHAQAEKICAWFNGLPRAAYEPFGPNRHFWLKIPFVAAETRV